MSHFYCKCDEIIRDQTDELPYKGYLLPDRGFGDFLESMVKDICSLIDARAAGRGAEWIRDYFSKTYPCNQNSDLVHDIITRHLFKTIQDVYQCPSCGRIWIEYRGEVILAGFAPESKPHPNVFRERTEEERKPVQAEKAPPIQLPWSGSESGE